MYMNYRMYVCMHACMYISIYMYIYICMYVHRRQEKRVRYITYSACISI